MRAFWGHGDESGLSLENQKSQWTSDMHRLAWRPRAAASLPILILKGGPGVGLSPRVGGGGVEPIRLTHRRSPGYLREGESEVSRGGDCSWLCPYLTQVHVLWIVREPGCRVESWGDGKTCLTKAGLQARGLWAESSLNSILNLGNFM